MSTETLELSATNLDATIEYEIVDGWMISTDGEVLGHILADDIFVPDTEEKVEWVFRLAMEAEAELIAIDKQRAAIIANLDRKKVTPRNRLAWIWMKWQGHVEEFAKRSLQAMGGKSKTLKLAHGSVAFRTTKGSSEITDKAAALAFVMEWAPSRLKYRDVTIADVEAAITAAKLELEPEVDAFFVKYGPGESVSIKTGIERD